MQQFTSAATGIQTSRLGFGCVGLTAVADRATALRLLETAYDHGITHFDTARLYGFGHSEAILGEFIKGKRDRVTVTTKFGLEPPGRAVNNARLIGIAKKIVRRVPFLANQARRTAAAMTSAGQFTQEAAARSIEKSIRELGTDRIDILLLHEGSVAEAMRAELRDLLDGLVEAGTVTALGLGTDASRLAGALDSLPHTYRVVQFQNNLLERWVERMHGLDGRDLITHSALNPLARVLAGGFAGDATAHAAGFTDARNVAHLLLSYALLHNPSGIVLCSTTKTSRIVENIRTAEAPAARDEVEQFVRAVDALRISASPC